MPESRKQRAKRLMAELDEIINSKTDTELESLHRNVCTSLMRGDRKKYMLDKIEARLNRDTRIQDALVVSNTEGFEYE